MKLSPKGILYFYYLMEAFRLIFRGVELAQHFLSNKANLELPEKDRFKFISHPTFVWWDITKKPIISRFLSDFKQPIQFFRALLNDQILTHIVTKTGIMHYDNMKSRLNNDMLLKFIGLELMRGYIGIRNMEMMWEVEEFSIDYPGKEAILNKNLWFAISGNLNFDTDEVHKRLIEQYKRHLVPGYNVTIDEIRIPCHHEACSFKNHNRDKPDIWAIESKSMHAENGYLIDFINPCQKKVPTPKEAVFQFAKWLKTTERRHHLVMDSNFLNVLDLRELYDMNFEATISCKSTRPSFIWKQGLADKIPVSYSRVASSDRISCVCTHNRGKPKIASTLCIANDDESSSKVQERRDLLKIYDELKGKADHFGQLYKAQYPSGFHKRWKTTLLLGWIYFTLTNAYILFNMRIGTLTHKDYVLQIAKDLIMK